MSNVHPLLLRLIVNGTFIRDFLAADAPCFALGMVEERQQQYGFLALRPDVEIPHRTTQGGFRLGHSLLGSSECEVVHFAFEFYGFATYNVLVNPNNPVVRTVLETMAERPDYFIFVVNAKGSATAFRSELGRDDLNGLKTNLPRIQRSMTADAQYEKVVTLFKKNPDPTGAVIDWVCRNNPAYLDLTHDRLEMSPSADPGERAPEIQPTPERSAEEPTWQPLSTLPTIAMILDGELDGAEEQLASLLRVRERPHVLDDAIVHRVFALYTDQLTFIPIHREQLARWRAASPSRAQREEITRLSTQLGRHEAVLQDVLALARELESGTIDAILRMDDGELGLAMFEGRIEIPDTKPQNEALRVREQRAIAELLDARVAELEEEGIAHLELLGNMAPQMPMFKRLMDISREGELSDLGAEYPGLNRFTTLLELIAEGIQSGDIEVPR